MKKVLIKLSKSKAEKERKYFESRLKLLEKILNSGAVTSCQRADRQMASGEIGWVKRQVECLKNDEIEEEFETCHQCDKVLKNGGMGYKKYKDGNYYLYILCLKHYLLWSIKKRSK